MAIGLLSAGWVAGAVGCAPKKPAVKPAATTRPLGPPIMDGRRGGGSFPLESTTRVTSLEALRAALEAGYLKRLTPPGTATASATAAHPTTTSTTQPAQIPSAVVALTEMVNPPRRPTRRAQVLPYVEDLTINVSNWKVRKEYEPKEFKEVVEETWLPVRHLTYSAEPLLNERGVPSLRMEAQYANLLILKDAKSEQRALVLAGAKRGFLRFYAPMSEMKETLSYGARRGAGRAAVNVSKVDLDLNAVTPQTLDAMVTVKGTWLFLDMTLRISGRLAVDDQMIATFSNLKCEGEGPAGDILAPFVDRSMKKMEGRQSPLVAFKDGKTKAKAFRVTTGDTFEMRVDFGQ